MMRSPASTISLTLWSCVVCRCHVRPGAHIIGGTHAIGAAQLCAAVEQAKDTHASSVTAFESGSPIGMDRRPHASVAPPPHPSFDLDAAVRLALEEDAGQLGDITTQAT